MHPALKGLSCIGCGAEKQRIMVLTMKAGDADVRPSILVAYALCNACDEEACGEAALTALRDAVGSSAVS